MNIIDQNTIVTTLGEMATIIRTGRLQLIGDSEPVRISASGEINRINGFKAYQDSKYVPGQRPPSDDEQPADIIEH